MKKIYTLLTFLSLSFFAQAQTFTTYTTADGLISDVVNCVFVAENDVLWFGTQWSSSK